MSKLLSLGADPNSQNEVSMSITSSYASAPLFIVAVGKTGWDYTTHNVYSPPKIVAKLFRIFINSLCLSTEGGIYMYDRSPGKLDS